MSAIWLWYMSGARYYGCRHLSNSSDEHLSRLRTRRFVIEGSGVTDGRRTGGVFDV